jgi:ribosomal protein S18 acetylase RimI-like enzyme
MRAIELSDRARLRAYFQRAPALHLYELGDLDDFFWPSARWYALEGERAIEAVALVYGATELPAVLALGEVAPLSELLAGVRERLPARFYAHLSSGVVQSLAPRYSTELRARSLKMVLADPARLEAVDTSGAVRLGPADGAELQRFYARSYPDNWFDPRMLETGHYFAIHDGEIVAAGGVHVYSPAERVAALGNIAVAVEHRGRGLGTQVTARIGRSLLAEVDHIGLNVHADNRAALVCYERLGFVPVAPYEEHMAIAREVT